ncbi:MAG TPA: hypothetical protein VNT99_06385, partial [Methylomirabilota bacterium]|nr:hypothetical protein [Methylomirabilota bacterium]
MWRSLLSLLCGLPVICSAQLTGEFQFHFTNNLPLWDFTGSYADNNATIQSEAVLAHAPGGSVTGSGSVHYQDAFTRFDATQTSKGRVTGSSRTRITVNVAGSGQFSGMALGRAISGPFDGTIALTLDPTNRTVSGRESATLCVRGVGCRTVATNVNFELPAEMDGTWSLTLNITTSRNAVRGT